MQCDATYAPFNNTNSILCSLVKRVDKRIQGDNSKHFYRLERQIHQSQKHCQIA
jgi:hypothetical protein